MPNGLYPGIDALCNILNFPSCHPRSQSASMCKKTKRMANRIGRDYFPLTIHIPFQNEKYIILHWLLYLTIALHSTEMWSWLQIDYILYLPPLA